MALLAPIFLAGLLALAVPIFVHLTHKERDEPVRFPSLMFLDRIPFKTVKRQRIRNWLLFILRSLAIILLVIAFARPLFNSDQGGVRLALGAREVVILLDRSFSMGHGNRWERAKSEARSVVSSLGEGDRATLVVFDSDAGVVAEATSDPLALERAIDAATVGSQVTRYGGALKLAQQLLEESRQPRLELVLITDYQRSGWDADEFVVMPEGTDVDHRNVSDANASNMAITSVFAARNYRSGREQLAVSARLVNRSDEAVTGHEVKLHVDDRLVQTVGADLEANSAVTVSFEPVPVSEGVTRMVVEQDTDGLPADDMFRFVVSGSEPQSVLVIDDGGRQGRNGLFLRRALSIGNSPAFDVQTKSVNATRASDIAGSAAVILNDVPFPGGATGNALRDYVAAGGGLLVVLGERSRPQNWTLDNRALLPGTFGQTVDRTDDRGGTLAYVDYSHPVFEVFSGPRSGDLSSPRFFRYTRSSEVATENVLARFDDGQVALARHTVGEGRVFVWTSTMDDFWNDLPLKPIYLPLVHELVKQTASFSEARLWATAGDVLDLPNDREVASLLENINEVGEFEMVVESPSGEISLWNSLEEHKFFQLDEHGFFEVRPIDESARVLFAVNLDAEESDLTHIEVGEVDAALAPEAGGTVRAGVDIELSQDDLERRQAAWWYLLVVVLVLLVVESVVSNRNAVAQAGARL